jgi:hypothetical protein
MRYFIDGQEVTAETAKEVENANKKLLQLAKTTNDLTILLQCKFITKI